MTPAPLTEADRHAAWQLAVSHLDLDRFDTRLGTDQAVKAIRAGAQCYGSCGPSEDGPYSDGANPEWWARRMDRTDRGVRVTVLHEHRDGRPGEVLRDGVVGWNELANRTTFAALGLRPREPRPGEQLALGV